MYDYSASQGTTASWNQFLEDMALVLLDFNGDLPSLKNIWEGVSMFESMFPVTDPFFLFSQDSPQVFDNAIPPPLGRRRQISFQAETASSGFEISANKRKVITANPTNEICAKAVKVKGGSVVNLIFD